MTLAIHATSIFIDGHGVLIIGSSGVGKSFLALALMEQGAELIADDVTFLTEKDGNLYASSDEKWQGCIEVRGIGIIAKIKTKQNVKIDYVIELTDESLERMPENIKKTNILDVSVPLFQIHKDEKFLPTFVKIAGKIVSKEVSLMSFDENFKK